MQKMLFILLVLVSGALAQQPPVPFATNEPDSLNLHLRPFKSYLNKSWLGTFAAEAGVAPMHDVSRWERILNGQAIRMMHSVNDGIYGGETILFWDRNKQSLVYYYFTTAGFFTQGTMVQEDGKWVSHEYVANNANGITEVRSTSELKPDGSMHNVAEFLQNGTWVPGHTIDYVESPGSQVVFK